MKKIAGCLVSLMMMMLLFVASQISYAAPPPPSEKAGENFQEEWPPPNAEIPCLMEQEHDFRHHPWEINIAKVKLDEKQEAVWKEVKNTVSKELIRKKADKQIAEIELHELLDRETVDLKTTEAKLKHIAALEAEIRLIVIKSMEKMKATLKPEQLDLLKKMRSRDFRAGPPAKGEMTRNEKIMPQPSARDRRG